MWCTVTEKITCKDCGEWKIRDHFYFLWKVYLLQPCKECRKKYWKNQYKMKVNLKNKIKKNEK